MQSYEYEIHHQRNEECAGKQMALHLFNHISRVGIDGDHIHDLLAILLLQLSARAVSYTHLTLPTKA